MGSYEAIKVQTMLHHSESYSPYDILWEMNKMSTSLEKASKRQISENCRLQMCPTVENFVFESLIMSNC